MWLWIVVRVLYSLNVSLPKLPKINVEQDPTPIQEKKQSKTPYVTRETQVSSDTDLLKKLEQATWKKSSVVLTWSKTDWTLTSGSLLKDGFASLLKWKIEKKIEEKEQAKPRPQIHFSWDKPTFSTSLLASNLSESQQIDEKAIVEKAQALQTNFQNFEYISI